MCVNVARSEGCGGRWKELYVSVHGAVGPSRGAVCARACGVLHATKLAGSRTASVVGGLAWVAGQAKAAR